MKTLDARIPSQPGLPGGKPCIARRRIAVEHVAIWHERFLTRALSSVGAAAYCEEAQPVAVTMSARSERTDIGRSRRLVNQIRARTGTREPPR